MESCNFCLAIVKRKCIVNIILQLHNVCLPINRIILTVNLFNLIRFKVIKLVLKVT